MSYYDDLSVGSSGPNSSSSDEDDESALDDDDDDQNLQQQQQLHLLWDRCILHLDIDCFYCQCEEIDRNLRNIQPPRPLAIGQKHIIVTSNYTARKYGVKKLQLREKALAACPDLWIVEGSDLQHYRRHCRKVYESFRKALQEIARDVQSSSCCSSSNINISQEAGEQQQLLIPARKGAVDEMMADLTFVIDRMVESKQTGDVYDDDDDEEQSSYIFGETDPSSVAVLVEDQTGQEALVSFQKEGHHITDHHQHLIESRRNVHETFGTQLDRQACIRRLKLASKLAARVCQRVRDETGFHTTCGISVSPLLAKLTSGLNKPKSVNLLYPWRSCSLLYPMPLRKMHNVGHKTMQALEKSLVVGSSTTSRNKTDKEMRTVRDLLELPRDSIVRCLEKLQAFQASGEEQCDLLIQRCRGLDTSKVEDDEGGLPKTVSVENSFRRGSVRNMDAIWQGLSDLFVRLPKLLQDRASWAVNPDRAYPTTIRLTLRMVDQRLVHKRRPYVTKSKQVSLNGKALMSETQEAQQAEILKRHITPLLRQLLSQSDPCNEINVTRMNIAVTNFQDVNNRLTPNRLSGQVSLTNFMHPKKRLNPFSMSASATGNSQAAAKRGRLDNGSCQKANVADAKEKIGGVKQVSPHSIFHQRLPIDGASPVTSNIG